MERTGVPASITLAQGILESGNGNSYLARQANNHFGIKCGNNWAGDEFYMDDDRDNECFRKYPTVEESYRDHSDFIRTNPRYESLFALDPTDYKGWARGLKEAGYATRRNYAELLIDIIQKHKLYLYDNVAAYKQAKADKNPGAGQTFKYNGITAYTVKNNETYQSIARKFKMDVNTLLAYNDLEAENDLKAGTILYLKPKKTRARESYHIVKENDNMYKISQEYGVKLASLLQYNLLQPGEEPAVGEIIYLKNSRKEKPELRVITEKKEEMGNELEEMVKNEPVPEKEVEIKPSEKLVESGQENVAGFEEVEPIGENINTVEHEKSDLSSEKKVEDILNESVEPDIYKEAQKTGETKKLTVTEPRNIPSTEVKFHFVNKGETLYSISRKYGVSVAELKEWNKLSSDYLKEGDTLLIKKPVEGGMYTSPGYEVTENTGQEVKEQQPDTLFHIVQPDETLYTISRKYNTTIIDLISKNKLEKYELEPGQKLIIKLPERPVSSSTYSVEDPFIKKPVSSTTPGQTKVQKTTPASTRNATYHIVQRGETLYSISRKYNTTVTRLKELNNLTSDYIAAGQKLIVEGSVKPENTNIPYNRLNEPAGRKYHVVQVDETLFSIARKYNITVQKLKELNNLKDNTIRVGQKLIIE